MWRILYFLLLFGPCLGIQPELEYQYRYNGRLAAGLPDINHQYAALSIQADVTIQMESAASLLVQLSDVRTGDYNGVFEECYKWSSFPIEDHPIEDGADFIHQPFRILWNETELGNEFSLQVSKDEPLWITNIKKAIYNVFPFTALYRVMKSSKDQIFPRPNFGSREELIGGSCKNWYSATKVPENQAAREEILRELVMEEDVQRDRPASSTFKAKGGSTKGSAKGRGRKIGKSSKTSPTTPPRSSVPAIDDTLWKVIRTVDYKMCEGSVEIMRINAPSETDKITSKSSTANYLIRGYEGGFRVERAIVEGSISVFTSNKQEDRIDTLTTQVTELRAVRHIREKLTINFEVKTSRHLYFETDERSREEGSVLSLEEALTGLHLMTDDVEKIKDTVISYLRNMNSDPKNVPSTMKKIAEAFTYLNYDQITALYDVIQAEIEKESTNFKIILLNLDILHMCLLSSGSEAALRLLIEKTKSSFNERMFRLPLFLFRNIRTVAKDPAILPLIMETAIGLRWGRRIQMLKSVALSETASLINKLCLCGDKGSVYVGPDCRANQRCEKEAILQKFLSYIEQELSNTTLNHKAVLLQALSNLGTPATLKILLPYILGTVPAETHLRTTAIMSLSASLMPNVAMNTVYNTLMPIIENHGEEPTVRSMAFLVMMSWNPGPSWWSRIAAATWNDPSSQVASFFSSTIRAVAESHHPMSSVVSKVVHFTKPTPPFSLTRPFAKFIENYIQCEEIPSEFSLLWYNSEDDVLPAYSTFTFNMPTLYGFPSSVKIDLKQQRLFQVFDKYIRLYTARNKYDDEVDESHHSFVEEMAREKLRELGIEQTKVNYDGYIWMAVNDILMVYDDYDLLHFRSFLMDFLVYILPGVIEFPYLYENVDSTLVYPTDLGLPLIVRHLDNTGILQNNEFIMASGKALGFDLHYRVSRSSSVEMTTLVPWSPKFGIGSGITNEMNLELPVNVGIDVQYNKHQYSLFLKPLSEGKRDVIYSSNQPFTVTYGGFPLKTRSVRDYKVVKKPVDLYKDKRQVFQASGYWLEHTWESDVLAEPPSFLDIIKGKDGIQPLHPSHCYWDYKVTLDPSRSRNNQLHFMFTPASVEVKIPPGDIYDYQEDQYPKNGDDSSGYSQISQSDLSQVRVGIEDIPMEEEIEDPTGFRDHYNKASRIHEDLKLTIGNHKVISVSVKFVEEAKTYRAYVLFGDFEDRRLQTSRSSLVAVFEQLAGEFQSLITKSCYKFGLSSPIFDPFQPLEDLILSTLSVGVNAEVNYDLTCSEPSAKLTGTFDIPKDQRQKMRNEILKECEGSRAGEHFPDAIRRLKFLMGQANVTWDEAFSQTWSAWASRRIYEYIQEKELMKDIVYTATSDRSGAIYYDRPNFLQYSVLDHILPASSYHLPFLSSYCLLDSQKLLTFDGATYHLEADSCWRVAVVSLYEKLLVLVRGESETWEAQVFHTDIGLHFSIAGGKVIVNGEKPKLDSRIYKVTYHPGRAVVNVLDLLTIAVSNKVEIQVAPKLRNLVAGLCGDFDGEFEFDLVGPKGCVYNDLRLFADSWSVPGDGCNAFTHRAKMRKVEEYREGCPTAAHVSTGNSTDYSGSFCTGFEYQSRMEGPYKCLSEDPIPICEDGCKPAYMVDKPVTYSCKSTDPEKQEETTCHRRTYVTHFPGECAPDMHYYPVSSN